MTAPKHARKKVTNPRSPLRELLEWVVALLIAVAVVWIINTFVFRIVRVDGPSMEPTLFTNERMFVTPLSYKNKLPERGDIVITHYPDSRFNYVKRVIGLPGDVVEIRGGMAYVNDQALAEPYLAEPIYEDFAPFTVPEGTVFVMGDNRNNSSDSRMAHVGPLPLSMLVGKVQYVVWPLSQWSRVTHGVDMITQ